MMRQILLTAALMMPTILSAHFAAAQSGTSGGLNTLPPGKVIDLTYDGYWTPPNLENEVRIDVTSDVCGHPQIFAGRISMQPGTTPDHYIAMLAALLRSFVQGTTVVVTYKCTTNLPEIMDVSLPGRRKR